MAHRIGHFGVSGNEQWEPGLLLEAQGDERKPLDGTTLARGKTVGGADWNNLQGFRFAADKLHGAESG